MASFRERYLTPEEYLAIERKAEYKSEYVDGVIYAMAGSSERHNIIVANLIISIGVQLRDRPCRVYPSDLKVRVPNSTRFFYPDVSVMRRNQIRGRAERRDTESCFDRGGLVGYDGRIR